ncbi:MAG: glycogen/starch/alpha-glucan phosphorylase, partial [Aeoliella sp.]
VYYLSMEYLTGRTLHNSLINLGLLKECRDCLSSLGLDLDELTSVEWETGLGNGGLGRLATCLLDSMSTLGIPAYGYGIRYEYGIFEQRIENGRQVEAPDNWLRFGNPWEVARPEDLFSVSFCGEVRESNNGGYEWFGGETVYAMAYDMPIPGYRNDTVNTLRLWGAKSALGFDLGRFNRGDYVDALEDIDRTESISRVLYPDDSRFEGKELRLKQEYFLASASLRDILRRYRKVHSTLETLPDKVAIQLNDTHPALAIPELMRVLLDEEGVPWEKAWDITTRTFAYTNHTLLPEALEQWPVELLERVLPRHLQIIYEINHRFLRQIAKSKEADEAKLRRMSLVQEEGGKKIRMSQLSIVGSHKVNGVSELHSSILRTRVFPDFDAHFPARFQNATNGITPRRWLLIANPRLAELITSYIGDAWICELTRLEELADYAEDSEFQKRWSDVKRHNKQRLAAYLQAELGKSVAVDSLFDCHVKRIHEYKRQLMNILHIVWLYLKHKEGSADDLSPRTFLIGGKAAPGYHIAKEIIQLVNAVADAIHNDPQVNQHLNVVFLPNYSVTIAEKVIPAADVSEQISTAGTEASGTSNMKFALNGAITVGTLDGANCEIREAVGNENVFMFGLTAEEVNTKRQNGYDACRHYQEDDRLRQAIDLILRGHFNRSCGMSFDRLFESLFEQNDPYMVMADFAAYADCQEAVARAYKDEDLWVRKSILNVASMGRFSSDRTVLKYAQDIWNVPASAQKERC